MDDMCMQQQQQQQQQKQEPHESLRLSVSCPTIKASDILEAEQRALPMPTIQFTQPQHQQQQQQQTTTSTTSITNAFSKPTTK
jgi:hypothetical protein